MKKIITFFTIIIATILSINAYGQDAKLVTTSCTITKPIKFFRCPELDSADGEIFTDGVSIIIKWNPIGDGGTCEAYINFGGEDGLFLINRWKDYDELHLLRIKNDDGNYAYSLSNSMFFFWGLAYVDGLECYGFDSTLKELD